MSTAQTQDLQRTATPHRLVHIDDVAAQSRWRTEFIGAYQAVFSRAPYFERFTPAEAEGVWTRLTGTPENITLIAVSPRDQIMGFGIAIPLRCHRSVARELAGLVSVPDTMYFAELGVLPRFRGFGVGRALLEGRLRRIDQNRYSGAVLRASASRDGNFALYSGMGFEEMGVSTDVSTMRVDGRVTTDRRVFLHCILSQLRLDGAPTAS